MAWIRWRKLSTGERSAYVQWRCPGCPECEPRKSDIHSEPLGIVSIEFAEQVRATRAAAMGTGARLGGMAPLEVLERYLGAVELAHPETQTRAFYDTKLRPLFTRYRDTPLYSWTRPMLERYILEEGCWMQPRRVDGEVVKARRDWSARTKQMVVTACRTFIGWAQDCRIPCADFVGRLRIPQPPREEHATLTRDQVTALMAEARSRKRVRYLELPIGLAALAGLSESDWRALTWDQVDLEAGTIGGRRAKTGERFIVAITPDLDDALRRHRAVSGPVCRGLPRDPCAARRALHRLQDRAGMPRAPRGQNGWKRLRHTFGTLLANAGVPAHERRIAMGHAPGSPMSERYTHPDDQRALDAVRGALG